MKILILYPNSFPYSGAATNRVISLARGLVETGNEVEVIITRPTENKSSQCNKLVKGKFKGIEYVYASGRLIWPSTKIIKIKEWLLGFFCTSILIIKKKPDIIISAATSGFFENIVYSIISRIKKTKFIHTLDEYPWVLINNENYSNLYRNLYLKYYYKLFDAFIIITKTLLRYYKPLARKNAKFVHIPMTVDFDRFNVLTNPPEEQYIAYCGGDSSGTKDGVDILVRAFAIVIEDFPDLKLYIAGNINPYIKTLIKDLEIENNVRLLGFVKRDMVPELLINAKALCLARPDNFQAKGGFPTKLGEYLASASPVIVTNVGEITQYLEDNVNAYIANPGDIDSFASKIKEVLDNTKYSNEVGKAGKIIAHNNFDHLKQGKALKTFLQDLL